MYRLHAGTAFLFHPDPRLPLVSGTQQEEWQGLGRTPVERQERGNLVYRRPETWFYGRQDAHRDLSEQDIAKIADTYHTWRGDGSGKHEDIAGFCKSATLEEVRSHGHVLTPGRYVGAEEIEDDGEPFEEKMKKLTTQLDEQFKERSKLEAEIRSNLTRLGFGL